MITKPSKIRPLFMQCSIYFFILHLLLQFSSFTIRRLACRPGKLLYTKRLPSLATPNSKLAYAQKRCKGPSPLFPVLLHSPRLCNEKIALF